MIDMEEIERVGNMLNDEYDEYCRTRTPYWKYVIIISGILGWAIIAFIICRSEVDRC